MTNYFIGTGGWAYFNVPNRSSLEAYSKIFNFVEVNYTFYEYPDVMMVERWRNIVGTDFTFTVRCHQDLTHRIGLRPVAEAYSVFYRMMDICRILDAPFLHLETSARYVFDAANVRQIEEFFSTIDLKGVRLTWEIRSPITENLVRIMQDFNIVHCVDLSREEPAFKLNIVYTRLFGKGKHNIYQFTDEELVGIDQKILDSEAKTAILSYHGARMNTDAARFMVYKKKGNFPTVTSYIGIDSAREVLAEDIRVPSSKSELIEHQGWKVIDLTPQKRVHLSDVLSKIPDKIYYSLEEVIRMMEIYS